MKKEFPAYYRPTAARLRKLWSEATVAVDASVLLSLYRYPTKTRDDVLEAFQKVKPRLWIPHYAALEFHQNRPAVIGEQKKIYHQARKDVQALKHSAETLCNRNEYANRHSLIDPEKLFTPIVSAAEECLNRLGGLEDGHVKIEASDPVLARIDKLFDGCIGSPPQNEAEVDELLADATRRYGHGVPPGYLDQKKEKSRSSGILYGGRVVERQYGDLIVWRQLLKWATSDDVKRVIFLTDDEKPDWIWTIESEGPKKMGAHPSLIDEARTVAQVSDFQIYSSKRFLELANEHLGANVDQTSIQSVEAINDARRRVEQYHDRHREAEAAVAGWIMSLGGSESTFIGPGFPDITVGRKDGSQWGVEVHTPTAIDTRLRNRLHHFCRRAPMVRVNAEYDQMSFVVVAFDFEEAGRACEIIAPEMESRPEWMTVTVGWIQEGVFVARSGYRGGYIHKQ